MSLYVHILCISIFSFCLHPFTFTMIQVPKPTFIFYTILRFSSNRYHRAFHFIIPNLNHKNNMDKTFYPIYYIRLFQILFYTSDISFILPLPILNFITSFAIKNQSWVLVENKKTLEITKILHLSKSWYQLFPLSI